MSKKNKSKFHKRIKAQLLQEITQGQKAKPNPSGVVSPSIFVDTKKATPAATATLETAEPVVTEDPLNYIKKDLKKSAFIIGTLIIIIAVLSIVDTKINFLPKIGDQIFRVLHISG